MPVSLSIPPPPPPLPDFRFELVRKTDLAHKIDSVSLPQQIVPKSSYKLKQFTWSKIPLNRITGKDNIWTKYAIQTDMVTFDADFYSHLEKYFVESKNIDDRRHSTLIREFKLMHSSDKINLLDSKKSLNINIFLKQFRW